MIPHRCDGQPILPLQHRPPEDSVVVGAGHVGAHVASEGIDDTDDGVGYGGARGVAHDASDAEACVADEGEQSVFVVRVDVLGGERGRVCV